MLLNSIVQLSLRSIRSAKLLKPVDLRATVKCRYGTKWISRKPIAIVNEHELVDTDDASEADERKTETRRKRSRGNVHREKDKKEKDENKMKNEIKESSAIERKYIALDADDKLIRYIRFSK